MRLLKRLSKFTDIFRPASYPTYSVASMEKDNLSDFNITKEDLKTAYLSHPIVNRALHFRADLLVARGFTLDFSDEKTKNIIDDFLINIKNNSPLNADLKTILRNACIDCDVFGNALYHLIPNKAGNKIVKLSPLHPAYTDFQRETRGAISLGEFGEPIGYVYMKDTPYEIKYPRVEVAHLIFETIGDELLGIPLLLPMYKTIERLSNIEYAIAQGLYKHGLPTRDISVGDVDHPPTADDINTVSEQVQDLDAASQYIHPYWYDVSTIESQFPMNIQSIPEFFLDQIIVLSGIPRRFLSGDEQYATTAQALQRNLSLVLEPLQARAKSWVEEQIFDPVLEKEKCDGKVELTWRPVLPQADPQLVADIISLSNTLVEGKPLITWKEAREKLKMPFETVEGKETTLAALSKNDYTGLYLVEPHGELIWRNRKRAIVKSVRFAAHLGEPLYLLSGKLCYGVIILDSPVEIDLKEFKDLSPKHLVSEEEREQWWPGKKKLFYYHVLIDKKFETPRKWKYVRGVQNFVLKVEFE